MEGKAPSHATVEAERVNGKIELSVTPRGSLLVEMSVHTGRQASEDNPELALASLSVPLSTRAAGELYRAIGSLLDQTGSE